MLSHLVTFLRVTGGTTDEREGSRIHAQRPSRLHHDLPHQHWNGHQVQRAHPAEETEQGESTAAPRGFIPSLPADLYSCG